MADNLKTDVFYTLDEERRELVPNGLQIGDGFRVVMRISKKYITGNSDDSEKKVNIDIGELANISVSLQRKTTADYVAGQRDPQHFSRGNVIGNGRLVCQVLDRELIAFIFNELQKNVQNLNMFKLVESQGTFGANFEIEEESESTITNNRDKLVGGSDEIFSKGREYVYLDDVPIFDLLLIGRADSARFIYKFGEVPKNGVDKFVVGKIYHRIINRVKFTGDANSLNAMDPIGNEVVDFTVYGNDSGWRPLP